MGFKFGLIQSLDPILSLKTFVAVVAFIILFEYVTEIIEYLLEESYAYSKMLQIIYKELMLMGVISFGIIMYEAANENTSAGMYDTIVAIDFVHIMLFYLTIFFVVHAFYLIRISIFIYRKYRHYFAMSLTDLAERVGILAENPWSIANILFRSDFILLSSLRDKVEFKMVQSVFNALYLVPKNFNYSAYIAGCYGRYALKTINRSFLSWIMFLMIIIVNFLRLYIGYTCTIHQKSAAHRHLLDEMSIEEEELLGGGSYGGGTYGGGSSHGSSSHHYADTSQVDEDCRKLTIREFLAAGAMVVCYNVILLIVSRIYKLRLVHMAGTNGSHEFRDFLDHIHNHEQEEKASGKKVVHRFTTKQFLDEINKEIGTSEHGHDDEEEEEFVHRVGKFMKWGTRAIREWMAKLRLHVRVLLVSCFCPERKAKISRAKTNKSVLESTSSKRRSMSGDLSEEVTASAAAHSDHHHETSPAATSRPSWHQSMHQVLQMRHKPHHKKHPHSIRERIRVDFHRPLPLTKAQAMHLDDTDLQNIKVPVENTEDEDGEEGETARPGDALLRKKSRMMEALVQQQIEEVNQEKNKKTKKSKSTQNLNHHEGDNDVDSSNIVKGIELAPASPSSATRQVTRLKSSSSMNPSRVRLPEETIRSASGGDSNRHMSPSQQPRQVVSIGKDDSPASSLSNSLGDDVYDAHDQQENKKQPSSRGTYAKLSVGAKAEDVELGLRMEQIYGDEDDGEGAEEENSEYDIEEDENFHREMYMMCPVRSYQAQKTGFVPEKEVLKQELAASGYVHASDAHQGRPTSVFDRIYFFHSPDAYARAIEFGIMANCLYMAIWVTNMISIAQDVHHSPDYQTLAQIGMAIPILTTFYILPFITETASLLIAISELNLGVVKKVLENTVETAELVKEVRREVMECSGDMENLDPERLNNLHRQYQTVLSEMQLINAQILKYQAQLTSLTSNNSSGHALLTNSQRGNSKRSSLANVDSATLSATIADMERLRHEKHRLVNDLKFQIDNFASEGRKEFIADLFSELDRDGSGYIDRDEFRELLRKLELTYNNHKFKLLFRAIDGDDGNGKISEDELKKFLFPTTHSFIEDIDQAIVEMDEHATNHNDRRLHQHDQRAHH